MAASHPGRASSREFSQWFILEWKFYQSGSRYQCYAHPRTVGGMAGLGRRRRVFCLAALANETMLKAVPVVIVAAVLSLESVQAQGTVTYLSNLGQSSTGSLAVGSDSWLAIPFYTGANTDGYELNSVQLAMTDASGSPSGFTVMLYGLANIPGAFYPGSSLGSLNGSTAPVTTGTYTYAAPANLTLSPATAYFLVLMAGTTVANGANNLSIGSANSYNPSGGWGVYETDAGKYAEYFQSSDGSTWNANGSYLQFAVNATAAPEPGVMSLLGMGGLIFGLCRWKKF